MDRRASCEARGGDSQRPERGSHPRAQLDCRAGSDGLGKISSPRLGAGDLQISAISDSATFVLQTIAPPFPASLPQWCGWRSLPHRQWVRPDRDSVAEPRSTTMSALGIMPRRPIRRASSARRHDRILLGAAIEAARQLGGDSVAALLFQITELGGKVIFGTVIIVVGLFLARILAGLVGSSTGESGYAQTIVKYAIIALFTAIGLTFMGLADQIVMMAFGLILGSAAVATAIAFGLGGRDSRRGWLEHWHRPDAPRPHRRPAQESGAGRRRKPPPPRRFVDADGRLTTHRKPSIFQRRQLSAPS